MTYCNLIDVPHLGSNVLSYLSVSWFSAETADRRYQVWHKNPPTVLDRHSMVVVPGLKSAIFHIRYGCWLKNFQFEALIGSRGPRDLKFGIQASNILYFHGQWSKSMDLNFFILPVNDTWSLSILSLENSLFIFWLRPYLCLSGVSVYWKVYLIFQGIISNRKWHQYFWSRVVKMNFFLFTIKIKMSSIYSHRTEECLSFSTEIVDIL